MSRLSWILSMNQILYLISYISFIAISTKWTIFSYPTCVIQKLHKELLIHATKYANEIDSKYVSNATLLLPSESPSPYVLRWCTLIHHHFPIAKWAFTTPVRLDVSSVVTLRFRGIGGKGCGEDPTTEDEPSFKALLRDRCQRGYKMFSFSPWTSSIEVRLIRASTAATANQMNRVSSCLYRPPYNKPCCVVFNESSEYLFIENQKCYMQYGSINMTFLSLV